MTSIGSWIALAQDLVAAKFPRLYKRLSLFRVDERQADIFLAMLLHNEISRLKLLRCLLSERGDGRLRVSSCAG